MPNNMNLHRNIFFKVCAKVPAVPFSALDSPYPDERWEVGDRYFGARSSEFGYANYEVIPKVVAVNPLGTSAMPPPH
jgi:hypothetical protein